jgi:hypothetical protein
MASWPERWQTFAGPGSWRNKYKNRDPQQGPAFPGATTWLVWLTDAWHLVKFLMILSQLIALGWLSYQLLQPDFSPWLYLPVFSLVGMLIRGLAFETLYQYHTMKSMLQRFFSNAWRRGLTYVLLPFAGIYVADELGASPLIIGLVVATIIVLLYLLFVWLDAWPYQEPRD